MTILLRARSTLADQTRIFDRKHYESVIRELIAEIERLTTPVTGEAEQKLLIEKTFRHSVANLKE